MPQESFGSLGACSHLRSFEFQGGIGNGILNTVFKTRLNLNICDKNMNISGRNMNIHSKNINI
jgi:hypothetical protein